MRILLTVILVLSLAACGKKKAPQAPAGGSQELSPMEAGSGAEDEKNVNTPADADDASPMKSSDPEEGGE